MFADLADEPRFVAIKESSENVRRITDLRNLVGDRYRLFCGVDDLVLESMILGIDNGQDGALCVLSTVAGLPPAHLCRLPYKQGFLLHRKLSAAKASGPKAKAKVANHNVQELDVVAFKAIIMGLGPAKIDAVYFECAPDHADRAASMKSMALSDGRIMAVLELCGLADRTHRILSHTWQGAILGKVPKGKTKEWAAAAASGIWPGQNWKATLRSTTDHPGFIDAALIALWGLRRTPLYPMSKV